MAKSKADFVVTARVDDYKPGDRLTLEVGDDGLPVSDLYRARVRPDSGKDDRELEVPSGGKAAAAKLIADAKEEAERLIAAGKAEADRLVNEATAEAAKILGGAK